MSFEKIVKDFKKNTKPVQFKAYFEDVITTFEVPKKMISECRNTRKCNKEYGVNCPGMFLNDCIFSIIEDTLHIDESHRDAMAKFKVKVGE